MQLQSQPLGLPAFLAVTRMCDAGVDQADSYEELCNFIIIVSSRSQVRHFILHARKCMLHGLSPAENRTIPPLRSVCRLPAAGSELRLAADSRQQL